MSSGRGRGRGRGRGCGRDIAPTSGAQSSTNISSSGVEISIVARRGVRGPTRNLKLDKKLSEVPAGTKLDLKWVNKRVVGKNSRLFKSTCTCLVRRVQNAPLQVQDWKDIEQAKKERLFELLQENFNIEAEHMDFVMLQLHYSYKNWRNSLKKKYDQYATREEALLHVPAKISKEDWQYLIDMWSTDEWQEMSQRNKANRANLDVYHTSGSKSFQQRADEEVEKMGREPTRIELWRMTHERANGRAVNEASQAKLDLMQTLSTQVSEGTSQRTEDEIFVDVFGEERHGRVRGYGAGITPSDLRRASSSNMHDLEKRLGESERRHEESERRLRESEQNRKADAQAFTNQINALRNDFESFIANLTRPQDKVAEIRSKAKGVRSRRIPTRT